MLIFNIDSSSPVPVYQQVKQALSLEIMSEKLNDGDPLPSIRSLAKILKINPNTVAKVYYSLEEEGYIQGKRGSGYIVKYQKHKLDKLKISIIEEELKNVFQKAFSLGFRKQDMENLIRRLLENES